ncbi:tetratricopeptide repeat protein [Aminobacter sp. UC22_36]|jgi:tetratricopeptide (TPR) repeat protein|uniref:tetratricopeptide repeat protein n=1 Tax=Aminobacter sp. UC22_36 TaxID=3374549 RepID=UPI003756A8D5
MGLIDGFGAAVSHGNRASVDAFHAAAVRMLGYAPDPGAMIAAVLAEDPDFIMGRCFQAGLLLTASDKRYQADLAREFALLERLAPQANRRELGHIKAIKLWLSGDFYAASQAYADILLDCPRDLCALQFGHQTDFLLGTASSTRDRPARIIRHWSEADPEYSYILGMLAFGLEESGHYAQAEEMALRCVALNPRDTWGVHGLAHCYEMQGKTELGISFMERCEENWAGENYLSIHNRWHLNLYHLENCDFDKALAIHDRYMTVTRDSALMDMHDSAAMLWRLAMDGVDCGDRWTPIAERYTEVIDQAYIAFNDMHAMMAFAATGREAEAQALIAAMEANAEGPSTSSIVIRTAGLSIVKGFHAFGRQDYATAKTLISKARHSAHLFGGSIAQRDVINLTLMEAAIRSGDRAMVEGLIAERSLMKPESPLTDFFRKRGSEAAAH